MTPAEILRAAKEKISDPARRCTGELARAADGSAVHPQSPNACAWCAEGSVMSFPAPHLASQDAYDYLSIAAHKCFGCSPWQVNDGHAFCDVETVFDRAIALAEKS